IACALSDPSCSQSRQRVISVEARGIELGCRHRAFRDDVRGYRRIEDVLRSVDRALDREADRAGPLVRRDLVEIESAEDLRGKVLDVVERQVTGTVGSADARYAEVSLANRACDVAHDIVDLVERHVAALRLRGAQRQTEKRQMALEKSLVRKVA